MKGCLFYREIDRINPIRTTKSAINFQTIITGFVVAK